MKIVFKIRRTGLTIVELLVVIAIMVILTAVMVPQVRLVNKDRNIREAARVVGTSIGQARDRAIATGGAGLRIERNFNLVDGTNAYYGGTRLYVMRNVPNYQGEGATVVRAPVDMEPPPSPEVNFDVFIPKPYQWDVQPVIKVGDRIRFNHGSILYPIVGFPNDGPVTPGQIKMRLGGYPDAEQDPGILPRPRITAGGPTSSFSIERSPRRIDSSRVDLPDGYIIDLRYSGHWSGNSSRFCIPATGFVDPDSNPGIELYFGPDGSLDRMRVEGGLDVNDSSGQVVMLPVNSGNPYLPSGSVDFFVTEYRPSDAGLSGLNAAQAVLNNPASLWVTLGAQTGGVNIGYNSPPGNLNTVPQLITRARALSRDRTSANQ